MRVRGRRLLANGPELRPATALNCTPRGLAFLLSREPGACDTRLRYETSEVMNMSILVERSEFDPSSGYQYYVAFNPNGTMEEDEVRSRVPFGLKAT